jgi:protein-histidine pros-kinase
MPNTPLSFLRSKSRRRDGLRASSQLYLAAGVALLIGMLVASYMQASAGLAAMRQFGIANQRADHLDRLNQLLMDAQSSTRGYALTENPRFLESYRATVPLSRKALDTVQRDFDGKLDADVARLVEQANAASAPMERITREVERGGRPQKAWINEGRMAMATFRNQHNAMKVAVLSENVENVRKSIKSFENARITSVLLALASLLLLVLAISQKQKKQELRERLQQLLEAENERLERDVRIRTEELNDLATYLTDVREMEKRHLASELHDELGALLTAAKLDADWIERKLPPESQALMAQRLARLRQSLTEGITLKRRIINDLRPALLSDLGLVEALQALADEFRKSAELEVGLQLPDADPELPKEVSLSLFRIVQEAFTNIRKYAQARHVEVCLRVDSTTIELSVADDGVGFDPDFRRIARHGLAGIKHRIFTHGGRLDVRTAPGEGVTLRAVIPR